MNSVLTLLLVFVALPAATATVSSTDADWNQIEAESLQHYQALLRLNTGDPPGNESLVADYLKQVLEHEGISVKLHEAESGRANLVARVPGSGRKRPLLLMAHTDVVRAAAPRWHFAPFGKDNRTAALMSLVMLKRSGIATDRDVILLAEAGEETATRVGIGHMVNEHFADIDAEYCTAEGGITLLTGGLQVNAIPSEAKATLDVRQLPGEDAAAYLETLRKVVNDPSVSVEYTVRKLRPTGTPPRMDTEVFRAIEAAAIPALGYGAHSDQERLQEAELHRFVRLNWDIVSTLVRQAR
jgi:acetylornithine deacetylase/succinyl-diaminopimelate desuccinylase-like protein